MEEPNKEQIQKAAEYPPEEFKNLSAEDVLRWLEQTNRFLRKFLKTEEILRWREIQSNPDNLSSFRPH
jgi:2-polyprenyl-3-methyl-5-hydroxy-6-metoxy-1,4-benzoquinol methylase